MKIARVFPRKTNMSPLDQDAFFGPPDLFRRNYDEIHISVTFSWDLAHAEFLKDQWKDIAPVKIGGPAIDGEGDEFTPGLYLKKGIVITSRGCPNHCPWCGIRTPLKELEIKPGNNIIDNNLLACSKSHIDKVFEMLKSQEKIKFSGGLEAARITNKIAEQIRSVKLRQLWTAYDDESRFNLVKRAFEILRKYFGRDYLGCYVLIGFGKDTLDKAEGRLRQILDLGGFPFAMLYRDRNGDVAQPALKWRRLQKYWSRPAYLRKKLKGEWRNGTD